MSKHYPKPVPLLQCTEKKPSKCRFYKAVNLRGGGGYFQDFTCKFMRVIKLQSLAVIPDQLTTYLSICTCSDTMERFNEN